MGDTVSWLIRFAHILFGVAWVGGSFLWGMIIAPNVLQRGPPMIRRPFLEAVLAKFTRFMIIGSLGTIITGFWVMGLIVGFPNIGSVFSTGTYGYALGVGVVCAVIMALEGFLVIKPAGAELLKTMQSVPAPAPGAPPAPPSPEVQAKLAGLGKKIGIASMTNLALGTIALGAMAAAVNLFR